MHQIQRLRERIFDKHHNIDGVMISKFENIGYLSGFWGSFGRLFITKKKALLVSDSRYSEKAKNLLGTRGMKTAEYDSIEYMELKHEEGFWEEIAKKLNIKTLGFEACEVSVSALQKLKKNFGSAVSLQKTVNLVETVRLEKSEEEITYLQKAATIGDQALEVAVQYLKAGVTEKEIAWIFEKSAREEFGADCLSFDTIVGFGKNSAIPHHEASDEKLKNNTAVLIDCGVKYRRYCSDMTRSFFYGEPTKKWLEAFELVHTAQKEGMKDIRPGKPISGPDITARRVFGNQSKYFGHSYGHGVGLEIHESPGLSQYTSGKFIENMAVTAEPGLYYAGEFGIRIEDLLMIGKDANTMLSKFPYTQIIGETFR